MANFQVGDIVIPHEYEKGKPVFCDGMRQDVGKPCKIEEITAEVLFRINGYFWPASALEPIIPVPEPKMTSGVTMPSHILKAPDCTEKPRYDLKEFTLAAMQGLCADPNCTDRDAIPESAVIIARATIKALQEAEKEGGK